MTFDKQISLTEFASNHKYMAFYRAFFALFEDGAATSTSEQMAKDICIQQNNGAFCYIESIEELAPNYFKVNHGMGMSGDMLVFLEESEWYQND